MGLIKKNKGNEKKTISLQSLKRNSGRLATRKVAFPLIFDLASTKPIEENKVIFLELRLPALSNSFQELYDELTRNYDLNIHCHFFRIGFVTKDEQYKRFKEFIEDAATAKYLIYAEGSDVHACIKKRKGQHIMNTWHAAGAFKRFGLSTADKLFGDSYEEAKCFPSHGDYDMVTVSSPEVVWAYAEAMDKKDNPECIKPIGLSRTDVFYRQETIDSAYEHLYDIMPQARGKKVISYAPTFRGRSAQALTPDMLDVGKFYDELKDDYVLIFKHHPIVHNRPQIPAQYSDFCVDFTDFLTIEELICVTDIMIADYSSTIFEYSIFEKPMVFFAYDLYNYFDWRGFYYNYDELTPGPVCFTNKEVIDYIKHVDERFDKAEVHAFRERFMSSCDGHATERIMKEFFEPSIENYRRKNSLTGVYHSYPDWIETFGEKKATLEKRIKIRNEIAPSYKKECAQGIKNGSVVLIADYLVGNGVFSSVRKELQNNKNFELHEKLVFDENDKAGLQSNAKILASAQYIIVAGEPYILRMIDVRPETKIIQICPEVLPIRPRWNNDPAVQAGVNYEDKKEFPIHSKYDVVMAVTSGDDELYTKNYPLKENGTVWHMGNVCMDVFKNEEFMNASKKMLEEKYPVTKGKKVILLLNIIRDGIGAHIERLLLQMHEEFARDYVVLVKADESNKPISFPDYLQGFALSVNMSPSQCIAAADIVVGDYGSDIYGAVVAGKEFYRWMPDKGTYVKSQDWNMDILGIFPESICESNDELINKLMETKNMSSEEVLKKQNDLYEGFKEKYLNGCDGLVSKRLVERIAK
ncbi:MAG: CDP-glycerol glycerophosphotransferase family protein [Butyrivibrio sp.]|nr:CDP-glycerol glycerophosphotransferase family protein [Butyrivibrio sp.]